MLSDSRQIAALLLNIAPPPPRAPSVCYTRRGVSLHRTMCEAVLQERMLTETAAPQVLPSGRYFYNEFLTAMMEQTPEDKDTGKQD